MFNNCFSLPVNGNENDISSESGSEGSSSIDSSSDEGSKNEPVMESLTNWSLSSFVKPDPKPIEKVMQLTNLKPEKLGHFLNTSNCEPSLAKGKSISPKCLSQGKLKSESKGEL